MNFDRFRIPSNREDAWLEVYELALEELVCELDRDPTDEEVESRAQYISEILEPDWDAILKDSKLEE
jgi:hypothetical protein